MHPNKSGLVRLIQQAGETLSQRLSEPDLLGLVNVIGTCANELLLREEPAFHRAFLESGHALLERGRGLLGGPVAPSGIGGQRVATDGVETEAALAMLLADLEDVVHRLRDAPDPAVARFLRDCRSWELSLYQRRTRQAASAAGSVEVDRFTRENLEIYLRDRFPDTPDLRITEFRSLPGGFSKFTTLFETEDARNGRQAMVARIEPPERFWDLEGLFVRREFPVVRFAAQAGIPVAEPLWLEGETEILGRPFFVSRKASGVICGTHSGATEALSPDLMAKMARILADIHNAPVDPANPLIQASHLGKWLTHRTLADNTRAGVEEWALQMSANAANGSPFIRSAVDWLLDNAPEDDEPPCLMHGDFGPHNVMVENDGITALLDWETARIGDPAEEFGHLKSATGGGMDMGRFIELYRQAGGRHLGEYRLRYFDVYDCTQRALACQALLGRVDQRANPNVNWIVYGLRYGYHYARHVESLIQIAKACRDR